MCESSDLYPIKSIFDGLNTHTSAHVSIATPVNMSESVERKSYLLCSCSHNTKYICHVK